MSAEPHVKLEDYRYRISWPLMQDENYRPEAPEDSFFRPGYAKTRNNPFGCHFATDIGTKGATGVKIVAWEPMEVLGVDRDPEGGEGRCVVLRGHRTELVWCIQHLKAVYHEIVPGLHLRELRDVIGTAGDSGNARGVHLHKQALVVASQYSIDSVSDYFSVRASGLAIPVDVRPLLLDALRAKRIAKAA